MDYPLMVFDNDFEFFNFKLMKSFDTNKIEIRTEGDKANRTKIEDSHIIKCLFEDMKGIPEDVDDELEE